MADGIRIPDEIAQREGMPEDLNAEAVGSYEFPDPRRRRTAAWIYLVLGAGLGVAAYLGDSGFAVAGAIAIGLAAWHLFSAWPLEVRQGNALAEAARLVPFAVGHASAAVTFHGLRARPRWHVVVYSPEEPPLKRALVVLDGANGAQVGATYVEELGNDQPSAESH